MPIATNTEELDRSEDLWAGVDALVDRAAESSGLRAQGLHLLAARRWRALGRQVPREIEEQEQLAAARTLATPLVLQRVRDAYDGPVVLMKGPEVASRYPSPLLRPYRDLDVLVEDAPAAQRALVAAGFKPVGYDDSYYADRQHMRPLLWPGLPLFVEVHRRPEWPNWTDPPPTDELLLTAVSSAVGVDGILALAPAEHALVLAAHSWSEEPLRRLLDLVDASVLSQSVERAELLVLAERWGIGGVWALTIAAADALLFDGVLPRGVRIWAQSLPRVSDRTVLERHVGRLLSPFWALPPRRALRLTVIEVGATLRPVEGEPWRQKLARSLRAARHPRASLFEHDAWVDDHL